MSDTVKLIIEISKDYYESIKSEVEHNLTDYYPFIAIGNGIPLDDIDSDETRAYFDGQAYGWEEGRKALIDDVKAEIETNLSWSMFDEYGNETRLHKELWEILASIDKESEGAVNEA